MPVYGTARRNMATSLRKACSFKVYGGREAKSDPMAGSMRHADGMTADPKPLLKMRDVGYERQRLEPPVI